MKNKICQSCGMTLSKKTKGTNSDHTKQDEYCYFCFENGEFVNPELTLEQQIEKLIQMAVTQFDIPLEQAESQANELLPTLRRWVK